MDHHTHSPVTPAGAPVTSCDLDETCADLDCDAILDEFGESLSESSDGQDFLAHYCGLDYVDKLQGPEDSEG